MSSYERPVNRSLYVAVLRKDDPSPLAPESDEEAMPGERTTPDGAAPATGDTPGAKAKAPAEAPPPADPVRIDLEGLGQRIVALPVPPGDYHRLQVAEGKLFYLKSAVERWVDPEKTPGNNILYAYDIKTRKSEVFVREAPRLLGQRERQEAVVPDRQAAGLCDCRRGEAAEAGVMAGSTWRRRRSWSIRGPSGGRSSRKPTASTATSSTMRRCTAWTGRRRMSSTCRSWRTSATATT